MNRRRNRRDEIRASAGNGDALQVVASLNAVIGAKTGPRKFTVQVMASGFGANFESGRQWYVPDTDEGLGSAVKVFGGAKVHWARSADGFDHRSDPSSLARWLDAGHEVGYLSDVQRIDGSIVATLNVADDVPDEIIEVIAARRVGLSIEAAADRRPAIRDGKAVVELVNFRHGDDPASVAVVSHPALAGEILRVAASRRSEPMNRDQAIAVLASTTATPEQIAEARKVLASTTAAPAAAATATLDPEIESHREAAKKARADAEAAALEIRASAARAFVTDRVAAAKLPELAAKLVLRAFESDIVAGIKPTGEVVDKEIANVRAALSADTKVTASGQIEVGAASQDKMALCLERMLLGNAPKYAQDRFAKLWAGANGKSLAEREQAAGIGMYDRPTSFRRTFRDFMGFEIQDLWAHGSPRRDTIRASINLAQWGDVFENVLNVAGLAMQENPEFGAWRQIVDIVPISGTLKQERTVVGGYANLPDVAEGAPYTAATSPGDEGHGYTPKKAGYTEDWTREAMMNDRIGALAGILNKMAVAADRTKYEFVFDKLTIAGQPTMDYDSTALYHANHGGNLLTTALATGLPAARLVMLKQAQLTNSKRMGLQPRFLIVPADLQETAENLLKPQAQEPGGLTSEREFLRRMNLSIIVVRHWTNTTDWILAADPRNGLVPTFEMGFEGGREMADIFVQDMANVGSVFERDAITVAIKQPYFGGSPLRHEGFVGNDVP